jgi:tetratricopeptide (TPR) repeat protein
MKVNWTRSDGALLLTVVLGLASVAGLSRWLDTNRAATDPSIEEEKLYLKAATVKRFSLGFNGLAADWYWMRSLQYVGRKIINLPENVQLENLGQLNLKLLAPLLDAAITLDPQFMEPYQYAAVVLPETDVQAAINIIRKGIDANPDAWRLYYHLGYIYWQQKDFTAASEAYGSGAALSGAPAWMAAMRARMLDKGGSRDTAREIYRRMYEEAGDDTVKDMARRRLMQLDSLDDREALRRLLAGYKSKMGRCPGSWQEMEGVLRALKVKVDSAGAPLDPAGTPYLLVKDKCDVDLDPRSGVPSK